MVCIILIMYNVLKSESSPTTNAFLSESKRGQVRNEMKTFFNEEKAHGNLIFTKIALLKFEDCSASLDFGSFSGNNQHAYGSVVITTNYGEEM